MLKLGLEYIEPQVKGSPFATELTAIFQEVIDRREKYDTVESRIQAVLRYFQDVTIEKIIAVIKKYTGLTCSSVTVSGRVDFGYYCLLGFPNWMAAHEIMDAYSGRPINEELVAYMDRNRIARPTVEDLQRIVNSLDPKTGRLIKEVKLASGAKLSYKLGFDPYSAFLMRECLHETAEYFLAPEIAAIILHEVGHMMSTIAHAADTWFRGEVYNRSLAYFIENASTEEKKKAVDKLAVSEADRAAFKRACDMVESKELSSVISGKAGLGRIIHYCLRRIFLSVWYAPMDIWNFVTDLPGDIWSIIVDKRNLGSWSDGKRSDFYYTEKNLKYTEQLADAFVAYHGMSKWMFSGFIKLDKVNHMVGFSDVTTRKSKLVYWFTNVLRIELLIQYGDWYADDEHEDNLTRLQTAIKEVQKIFKRTDIPPEMAKAYILDLEQMKNQIPAMKSVTKTYSAVKVAYAFIRYIVTIPGAMLFSGRFGSEYNKLYSEVERMMSNDLFYHATKLEQLANSRR